jgi:diguanylate cyclase
MNATTRQAWQALTQADATAPGEGEPAALTASNRLQDVTVMMIDDESMMTDVIQTYLEEAGYSRFISINDPRMALGEARRHRPGLVLLDLFMPGLSGFEILEQMRRDEQLRYIPVIVLTAASHAATKLKALELGATEFLSKPVDASELVLRVRNSLVFKTYQDRLANLDPLTGLPNRRVFVERLQAALAASRDRCRVLGLLHIGLDRFRKINDSLGRGAGDQLLADVAQRLHGCLRRGDGDWPVADDTPLLSRLAGDEFAVLLPDLSADGVEEAVARRILAAMASPFLLAGQDVFVTPSIGIALYPDDGDDDEALRRSAELAMAQAKANGRNTFQYHLPQLDGASAERLAMETLLRRAIERRELVLYYQPKVEVATGRLQGAEALLRWMNPELGLVPPCRFIPIAEDCGLIIDIGEWVLQTACAQMAAWREQGLGDVSVAINVSRHEVTSGKLVDSVAAALLQHAIRPGQLVVELTESMLMDRQDQTRLQLDALRALGVQLSIDDFGTGYSSMNYLKRFPLDELKIDKSFVDDIPGDRTNSAIVQAMVVLSRSLGMRVVAEGVETEPQLDELRRLGCDSFQGYLCSRPVPAKDFAGWLTHTNASR